MSRSKRVRTLKTRREKEREEEEGRRGWKGRMHETSAEFRPSFSLSFSDLSPALRPLNLPEKRAFKAERTREAGITMSNLVTRDRISRSIIPPSSSFH